MNKILAFACAAGLCVNAYADVIPLSTIKKNAVIGWSVFVPLTLFVKNDSDKNKEIAFLVKDHFDLKGKQLKSDTVSFLCNGSQSPMQTDIWMICDTVPGKEAGIILAASDYKNGASGLFETK